MNGIRKLYAGPKCPTKPAGSGRAVAMAYESDVRCVREAAYFRLHMYQVCPPPPHRPSHPPYPTHPPPPPHPPHPHATPPRSASLQVPIKFSPPLPVAFDWKKNLSPVKTQGLCSSCWAFASTTVMEASISIQYKKTPIPLSPQSMVDCYSDF